MTGGWVYKSTGLNGRVEVWTLSVKIERGGVVCVVPERGWQ